MRMTGNLKATVSLAVLILVAGCNQEPVAELIPAERAQFLLAEMPGDSTTIGAAKEKIDEAPEVVVLGWADLKHFESDKENRARVLVREILDSHDHGGEGHDPSSCVFCRRRMKAAPKAAVVFVDEKNQVLPYRVDQLFPVKHGDEVVIRGTGKFEEGLDLFKITARGIYLPGKAQ